MSQIQFSESFSHLYLHPLTHPEFASILLIPHSDMGSTILCTFPYKTNEYQCMFSVYTPLGLHLLHATQEVPLCGKSVPDNQTARGL